LPKIYIPKGDLHIHVHVCFSNKASDVDNVAKPFIDILQKKYKFNDNRVYKLSMTKEIVLKSEESIQFFITSYVAAKV